MKNILAFALIFLIAPGVQAQSIEWVSLSKAQEQAVKDGKKVMLFAEAEWCGYCQKMYEQVFPEQSVQDSLSKYFHPVRIDIESEEIVMLNGREYSERDLARKFRATRTPTTIFLDSEGSTIGAQPGFLPAKIFDKLLSFVGSDLTGKKSFSKYLSEHGVEVGQ